MKPCLLIAALALVGAGPAGAVCSMTSNGTAQCSAAVKDLFVPIGGSTVMVRLHDTDASLLACALPSGYWTLKTNAPNHDAQYELLMLSAASNLRVEIRTAAGSTSGSCEVQDVRLIND